MVHRYGEIGAGQVMARIAGQLAAHDHFITLQVQLVVFVERQGKRRQNELVHTEIIGGEVLLPARNLDVEIAVALALGQGEGAGNGTEFIGFQIQALKRLSFGIEEGNLESLARNDGHAVHKVALIHDGLELEDVAGIVGAAVTVDVAIDIVRLVVGIILRVVTADAQSLAFPQIRSRSGFCRKGVVGVPAIAVKDLLKLLGEQCKTVQADRLGSDFRIPLPEREFRLIQRLAAQVIRNIGRISLGLAAEGQRKPVLVVDGAVVVFPVQDIQCV